MNIIQELSATWLDIAGLSFFIIAWIGYAVFASRRGKVVPSLQNRMDHYRRLWMVRMIERDNRMVDVNVMRNVTRSSQFFASTTMLILGALVALTGYVQQTLDIVSGLPFTVRSSARLLEIKIVLLVVIFVYAVLQVLLGDQAAQLLRHHGRRGAGADERRSRAARRHHQRDREDHVVRGRELHQWPAGLLFRACGARLVPSPVADDRRHDLGRRRALPQGVCLAHAARDVRTGRVAYAASLNASVGRDELERVALDAHLDACVRRRFLIGFRPGLVVEVHVESVPIELQHTDAPAGEP